MSDQVQEVIQEQVTTEAPTNETTKPVVNEVEQKYKNEIGGLNRRNSELEQLLKEKESFLEEQKKATMADEEKRLYELEQRENTIIAKEQEITRLTNKTKASKFMSDNDIPMDLLDTISLDNWEVAQSKLEVMKGVIDTTKTKTIEEFKTQGGHVPPPGGGVVPQKITRDQLKHMSPVEIAKAADEGRIPGVGSTR
jgi:hypothetical protein